MWTSNAMPASHLSIFLIEPSKINHPIFCNFSHVEFNVAVPVCFDGRIKKCTTVIGLHDYGVHVF